MAAPVLERLIIQPSFSIKSENILFKAYYFAEINLPTMVLYFQPLTETKIFTHRVTLFTNIRFVLSIV